MGSWSGNMLNVDFDLSLSTFIGYIFPVTRDEQAHYLHMFGWKFNVCYVDKDNYSTRRISVSFLHILNHELQSLYV